MASVPLRGAPFPFRSIAPTTTAAGVIGETLAGRYLRRLGFAILERNYRIRGGEIDLVAREQDVLCFVEVRSRTSAAHGHPLETVDWRKRKRLLRAVRHYLATRAVLPQVPVRLDVLAIVYQPALRLTLVRNAFQSSEP